VFSIKALAVATAVSAGVVFAMPVASQAMPQSTPVKVDTATNSNIVNVRHKSKRWARYCRYNMDSRRCNHRRPYARSYRYRDYDEPYYSYYRPYRPARPGIYLNID
jgi:hypothetical protein